MKTPPPPLPVSPIFEDSRGSTIRAARDGSVMLIHAPEPVIVTTPGARRLVESIRSIGRVPATEMPLAAVDEFVAKVNGIMHQKEIEVTRKRLGSEKTFVVRPEDASFKAYQAELIGDLMRETVRNYL